MKRTELHVHVHRGFGWFRGMRFFVLLWVLVIGVGAAVVYWPVTLALLLVLMIVVCCVKLARN